MDSFGEMVSREMQNRKTSRERSNDVFNNSFVGFMVVFPMKIIGRLIGCFVSVFYLWDTRVHCDNFH
jgi:hypothetical protein